MTNSESRGQGQGSALALEYGLAALRGDCARMVPHWVSPAVPAAPRPVPPSRIRGVVVPVVSARLLDAMDDGYGG